MYRRFLSLTLSTLRLLTNVIGIALGSAGVELGAPFPRESDVDADRRWREEVERKRPRQTGGDHEEN